MNEAIIGIKRERSKRRFRVDNGATLLRFRTARRRSIPREPRSFIQLAGYHLPNVGLSLSTSAVRSRGLDKYSFQTASGTNRGKIALSERDRSFVKEQTKRTRLVSIGIFVSVHSRSCGSSRRGTSFRGKFELIRPSSPVCSHTASLRRCYRKPETGEGTGELGWRCRHGGERQRGNTAAERGRTRVCVRDAIILRQTRSGET